MRFNLPARVRAALYVLTTIGTPTVAYLFSKGLIGELEVSFYASLATAVTAMAALNTKPTEEEL